jgi:maltose alpha-D-glucosyltransferase/alpha-amylase
MIRALDHADLVLNINGIEDLFTLELRAFLEADILPDYLARRRWFASKDRAIDSVRIAISERFPYGGPNLLLTEIVVQLQNRTERYQLPLGLAWDDDGPGPLAAQLALCRVRRGDRIGFLTDGFALDGLPHGVMRALRSPLAGNAGETGLLFSPTTHLDAVRLPDDPEIHRLSAEQSNSSLIIGGAVIMKLIRRVMQGTNPEVEMVRFLTEQGYANTPPLLAEVSRANAAGTPHSMFVLQTFVPNQGDAWGFTLDVLTRAPGETQGYAVLAAAIGVRLKQLHEVLARPCAEPAFQAQMVAEADVQDWAEAARHQMLEAFQILARFDDTRDARFVLQYQGEILDSLQGLAVSGLGTMKTRIHGDFHLGQVLVAGDDAYIIDFEGEPAKTVAQRRAKSSPMRDVAGLLRSFQYAAAIGGANRDFVEQMSGVFLTAYGEVQDPLLALFLLEKSAYEICYEAANRPEWLAIPLRGFTEIAGRVLGQKREKPDA